MSPRPRRPLERVLVATGRAADLDEARALVAAGRVVVAGAPAMNPSRSVAAGEPVEVVATSRYVSRGGDKLDAALEAFGIDVVDQRVLDVGASTGGFTDCVLQRGAGRVLAVDVGRNQLHERLRGDPRVVVAEGENAYDLRPARVLHELGGPADVLTVDVSFTSLARLAPHLVTLAGTGASIVALVKPQFEVDRATASRGRGVVRDAVAWSASVVSCTSALRSAGAGIMGVMASPLRGAAGNVEFLVHAIVGDEGMGDDELEEAVRSAVVGVPR